MARQGEESSHHARSTGDSEMTTLIAQGPVDVNVSRCTVRVKTTVWADKRGLHTKKSLTFLRRQCEGFNVLAEDVSAIGAEEVLQRLVNLGEVEDGIYEVVVCNESHDYETGYVDDYDYRLVTANAIGQRGAACGASAGPTGCASNGDTEEE